jgi:hypothetical protein
MKTYIVLSGSDLANTLRALFPHLLDFFKKNTKRKKARRFRFFAKDDSCSGFAQKIMDFCLFFCLSHEFISLFSLLFVLKTKGETVARRRPQEKEKRPQQQDTQVPNAVKSTLVRHRRASSEFRVASS